MKDQDNRIVNAAFKYSGRAQQKGLHVAIYCPYIVLNKTGVEVTCQYRDVIAKVPFTGQSRLFASKEFALIIVDLMGSNEDTKVRSYARVFI